MSIDADLQQARGEIVRLRAQLDKAEGEAIMLRDQLSTLGHPTRLKPVPVSWGMSRIIAERQRQIEKGYTVEHDAEHNARGELGSAAAALAVDPALRIGLLGNTWPWPVDRWPGPGPNGPGHVTRIQELERAGALVVAELDRLHPDRKEQRDDGARGA